MFGNRPKSNAAKNATAAVFNIFFIVTFLFSYYILKIYVVYPVIVKTKILWPVQ